jgi:hypothetical protein
MYGIRNDNTALSDWAKIALVALLLGSGSAAITPTPLAAPDRSLASGEETAAGGSRLIIRNDGNLVLYEGGRSPSPIPQGGP